MTDQTSEQQQDQPTASADVTSPAPASEASPTQDVQTFPKTTDSPFGAYAQSPYPTEAEIEAAEADAEPAIVDPFFGGSPKTLHNSDLSGATINVSDLNVVGDGDAWQLLCKASSENEGWMKSTKAMPVPGVGCLVQITTQQRNFDGTYAVAEALTMVHGAGIAPDKNGGRRLVFGVPSK